MNKSECNKLMAMIKANYPAYHAKTDTETQTAAVNIMATILADLDSKDCEMALVQYMTEPHEFPPNAGQIRYIATQFHTPYNMLDMAPIVKSYWQQVITNKKLLPRETNESEEDI